MKTYSENMIKVKDGALGIALWAGLAVGVLGIFVGALRNDIFLVRMGVGIVLVTVIAVSVYWFRVLRVLNRCDGNVFEVKNGKVVAYHEKPFVYDNRTIKNYELVPFQQDPISVEKTLRLPMYGNVLSYRVTCSARVSNRQKFYDIFLHPEKKFLDEPESVLRTCAATFLQQNKQNIVDLCMDEFAYVPAETRGEHVEHATRNDVEAYLQGELKAYGMCLCEALLSCSLKPVVIE